MRSYLVPITALLIAAGTSYARPVTVWTYNDLLAKSDLVVIANATGTRKVADTDKPPITIAIPDGAAGIIETVLVKPPNAESFVLHQVETTFHVRAVLKGRFDKKRFGLVHFRWMNNDKTSVTTRALLNFDVDPRFVAFPAEGAFLDKATKQQVGSDCLLFLRLRKDGRYEPVSGQFDPAYSVRWLNRRR